MRGAFPEEILDSAEERCISHVRAYHTVEGLLCLYFLKCERNQTNHAEYILRMLVEYPLDNMDSRTGGRINNLLKTTWGYNIPSYFDLFKKVLTELRMDEIFEYMKFASSVSPKLQPGAAEAAADAFRLMEESLVLLDSESGAGPLLPLFFRLKCMALLGYAPDFLQCCLCRSHKGTL